MVFSPLLSRNEHEHFIRPIIALLTRHQRVVLWISIFSFYLVSAMLDIYTTNPGSRFMLTRTFARHFRFWIDPEVRDYYSSLDYAVYDGKIYSDKPPVLALLAVPLYWLGMILSWIFVGPHASSWEQDTYAKIIIVIGILLVNSLAMLRIYDILTALGYSKSTRFLTTVSIAFGTLFFPYAHTFFSHDLVGSFLILATYHLVKMKQDPLGSHFTKHRLFHALLAGSFLGVAMGSEYFVLFSLPLFYLFVLDIERAFKSRRRFFISEIVTLAMMTMPILACGLFILWYNWMNFGSPFSTAYEHVPLFVNFQHFLNPMLDGIEVMLFSNNHGLFLFNPLMFLAFIAIPFALKRHPRITTLGLSFFLMLTLYYAKYWKPDGGLNYGIRFLLPAVPLFMLNMAALLEELHEQRNPLKWPTFLIFAIPSFIFSQAGGWISIFPSGGEGMQDPLFGDETGTGHVPRFYQFVITIINPQVLLGLLLNQPFPSETASTLLREFPFLAFFVLLIFFVTFILASIIHLLDESHESEPIITNDSKQHKNEETTHDNKSTFLENIDDIFVVGLSGLHVTAFLLLHVHVLARELSTIPDAADKFTLYPEDLQIILMILLGYMMLCLYLLVKRKNDLIPTHFLGHTGVLGALLLGTWMFTIIPPFNIIFQDTNKHVTVFFMLSYHLGLGFLAVIIARVLLTVTVNLDILPNKSEHGLSTVINGMREQLNSNDGFIRSSAWLITALLAFFVFGRVQGLIYFLTVLLQPASIFSMTELIWTVIAFIELVGLLLLSLSIVNMARKTVTRRRVAN